MWPLFPSEEIGVSQSKTQLLTIHWDLNQFRLFSNLKNFQSLSLEKKETSVSSLRYYFEEKVGGFTKGEAWVLSCHLTDKRDSEMFWILAVLIFLFSYLLIKLRIYHFLSVWLTFGWNCLVKICPCDPMQFIIAKLWEAEFIPVCACLVCCNHSQRSATSLYLDLWRN